MRAAVATTAAAWTQEGQQAQPAGGGFWQWLLAVGSAPGVVEFVLAAAILGFVVFFWWRLARLCMSARSRAALSEYLLGVEQALHGDLAGAHARLLAVVAHDPENHYARLLLGKVLAERGEAEAAHQQHVCLKTAFGVDSAENDLMLARSLLAAGLPREAAETAERAVHKAPERAAAWDFVYRAHLQCGDFEKALAAGRRLFDLLGAGNPRTQLADDLARTFVQAGSQRLWRGDAAGAGALLQDARRFADGAEGMALLAARLDAQHAGVERTVQGLLVEASPAGGSRLPAVTAPRPGGAEGLPMATFAGLIAPSRWYCRSCGGSLAEASRACPRCHAVEPARLREPLLVGELPSPIQAMDAIDVNDAHVQRLVQRCLDGGGAASHAARAELLELRGLAVGPLLRAAWNGSGAVQENAIELLRAMGPGIAPALFAASDELGAARLLPIGSRSPAALVGRVVQGFDRAALPHVEPLFASAKPEHRKILIDFFLGLADLEQFQLVLERFPPMEILHRLNKADAAVLRRFVQVVPRGHFVAETLLLEPTFYRDEEVLAAIPGAAHPDVLEEVLVRRGATRTLTKVLIAALCEPALAGVAERLLGRLGDAVFEHVLAAFLDAERSGDERARLARVLVAGGASAARSVAAGFGPEPSAFDDDLRDILGRIGDAAVPELQAAYGHSGWLEKVAIGLISRHTNRRAQIVASLRTIGTPAAAAALRALAVTERDANLRLRLQQALHALEGGTGADDGGAHGQDR